MKAINKSKSQARVTDQTNVLDATSKATVALFGVAAVIIGLWAVACFAGAIIGSGPLGVIKGYFAAVTGL